MSMATRSRGEHAAVARFEPHSRLALRHARDVGALGHLRARFARHRHQQVVELDATHEQDGRLFGLNRH